MATVTRHTAIALALVLCWCCHVQLTSATCSKPGFYICNNRGALSCVAHTRRSCNSSCSFCPAPANGRPVCGSGGTCSFECRPGFELASGSCRLCRLGFFKAGWLRSSTCQSCPPGTLTIGSSSSSRDNINDCVTPSSECGCQAAGYQTYNFKRWAVLA